MKSIARIFGLLLVLVGGVWMGQGLGYLPGSFMTGQMQWFYIGGLCLIAGVILMGASLRRG